MNERRSGQIEINSAFEAVVSETVLQRHLGKDAPHVRHSLELPPTLDEVKFLDRERMFGTLLLSHATSEQLELGLVEMIVDDKPYGGVRPEHAEIFLNAIHQSRLRNSENHEAYIKPEIIDIPSEQVPPFIGVPNTPERQNFSAAA